MEKKTFTLWVVLDKDGNPLPETVRWKEERAWYVAQRLSGLFAEAEMTDKSGGWRPVILTDFCKTKEQLLECGYRCVKLEAHEV